MDYFLIDKIQGFNIKRDLGFDVSEHELNEAVSELTVPTWKKIVTMDFSYSFFLELFTTWQCINIQLSNDEKSRFFYTLSNKIKGAEYSEMYSMAKIEQVRDLRSHLISYLSDCQDKFSKKHEEENYTSAGEFADDLGWTEEKRVEFELEFIGKPRNNTNPTVFKFEKLNDICDKIKNIEPFKGLQRRDFLSNFRITPKQTIKPGPEDQHKFIVLLKVLSDSYKANLPNRKLNYTVWVKLAFGITNFTDTIVR